MVLDAGRVVSIRVPSGHYSTERDSAGRVWRATGFAAKQGRDLACIGGGQRGQRRSVRDGC